MTNGNDLIVAQFVDFGPDDRGYTHDGLTKREYFAAMAMQGLCAGLKGSENVAALAPLSVSIADALITALNSQP